MKIRNAAKKTIALTSAIGLLTTIAYGIGEPNGSITVDSSMIQEGQFPTINWNINYPPSITDVVIIDETKPPKTKKALKADVRTIGQGVTGGLGADAVLCRTRGLMKLGSSRYITVFDGVNTDVTSQPYDLEALFGPKYKGNILPANTTMRFGGDVWESDDPVTWSDRYSTGDGTRNVRTLIDGDSPPVGLGYGGGPTLESFLKPYLDSSGKINIGPMDMIVFMELTHTPEQSTHHGYDFQDLLLLVSFTEPVIP